MFKFIQNQNQRKKIIVMIIVVMMTITGIPFFSLAAEDKTPPEIIVNVKAGRIKAGSGNKLSFTITDRENTTLKRICYQWDRNLPGSNTQMQEKYLTANKITSYTFEIEVPTTPGLHEFSIAAQDDKQNLGNWMDIPYYVVTEDIPADYKDETEPQVTINIPAEYHASGATIPQVQTMKIKMED